MSEPGEPIRKPARLWLPGLVLAGFAVAASLYAFVPIGNLFGGPSRADQAKCAAGTAIAQAIRPLAKGEIAALQVLPRAEPATPLSFKGPNGEALTLENFRGRTILLNLWATWCAPCRHEMPSLDRLQAEFGGADFEVVAINIDTRNFEKPKQFLDEVKVNRLAYYADPSAKVFQDLKSAGKAFGMPTTLLIDKAGCEFARLAGPAEWSSPEAFALVKATLGR